MARPRKNQVAEIVVAEEVVAELDAEIEEQGAEAVEATEVVVEMAPAPLLVVEEKEVPVYPVRDLPGVMIARKFYNLKKGEKLMVPPSVRDHLKEKGLC